MPSQCVLLITGTCNCFASVRLLLSRCSDLSQFSDHDRNRWSMTPNTSIVPIGGNSEHLVEFDDEQQRAAHLAECHEASHRPSRTSFKADGRAHGTQAVLRTEVKQERGRIEEWSGDSFLRFRDEWVRNRAREVRQAGSISFNTCSEDTASITALNEFYRWRVFDGFKAEHRDGKELEIEMMRDSRDLESFPEDVAAAEKFHMCRIVCRETGRQVFRKTCHRRARSRA